MNEKRFIKKPQQNNKLRVKILEDSSLTPVAFGFFEALRPFSGFSGRHSSTSSSFSSSLDDISSSTLMSMLTGALAVVKRFVFGFHLRRRRNRNQDTWTLTTAEFYTKSKSFSQVVAQKEKIKKRKAKKAQKRRTSQLLIPEYRAMKSVQIVVYRIELLTNL